MWRVEAFKTVFIYAVRVEWIICRSDFCSIERIHICIFMHNAISIDNQNGLYQLILFVHHLFQSTKRTGARANKQRQQLAQSTMIWRIMSKANTQRASVRTFGRNKQQNSL